MSSKKFPDITVTELLKQLKKNKIYGIALDIDDTLSYSDNHWALQMGKKLQLFKPHEQEAYLSDFRKRAKSAKGITEWNSAYAQKTLQDFIHSHKFHQDIPLIENANHMVNKINEIVPIVAYITARPNSVIKTTQKWLSKHDFVPAPVITRLNNQPHKVRNIWKAKVLTKLYPYVTGIIDDQPKLKLELKSLKYQGQMFLYDNGQNHQEYKNHVHYKTWTQLLKAIKQNYKNP